MKGSRGVQRVQILGVQRVQGSRGAEVQWLISAKGSKGAELSGAECRGAEGTGV